jgi:DNA polymerase
LLNKILEAIHFRREEVYICNILKCRPPGNRKPAPEEVEQCIPYLKRQIELIRPRVILCLGLTAAETLLQRNEPLGKLRGRVMEYEGTPLMVTYHPAALLRNPEWKRPAWEDVQAIRKLHDELVAKG